jgi:K+-sensing histidine kinase KdpD
MTSTEGGLDAADRAPLAGIRHDLRTPLNAIIGDSEMLLEDAADLGRPDLVTDLQHLRAEGARLLSSVDATLDPATSERSHGVALLGERHAP